MTFSTSLTGLNAAQNELAALSNNIANAGTSGFKKSDVQFGDIVTRSASQAANSVAGVGVATMVVKQQFSQGGYESTSNALDLMIGGSGFFLVKGGGETADSLALSRNGSFTVDASRHVIDNEGRRLQVLPTTTDGVVTAIGASGLQPLRLPEESGAPIATSAMHIIADLPAGATAPIAPFNRADPTSYNHATSQTIYDAMGNAKTATIYYRHTDSPPGDTNKYWEVNAFVGNSAISPVGGPAPLTLTFDANGVLTTPAGAVAFDGGFTISHADTSVVSGPYNIGFASQNGYGPGRLESVGVDLQGVVRASFSNGETIALGKVALANVPNPQGLKQNGNVSWQVSAESGGLLVGQAGQGGFGTISSGALERSNVDLTEELVGLISAQRNFQANARAIDTASSLLQTIIQLRN